MKKLLYGLIIFSVMLASLGISVSPAFASDSIDLIAEYPAVVAPGQSFCFKVTAKVNDGQLLESRGDMLRNTDGNLFGHWPHIAVSGTVNTGQTYTFQCYGSGMTAPSSEGTYESKWRVWRNGSWAGAETVLRFKVQIGGGETQIPPAKSNAAFDKVKVGDIILARADSNYSSWLSYLIGGYWSHAAIVVEVNNGVPFIAESYSSVPRPPWWPGGTDRPGVVKRSIYETGIYKDAQDVIILRVRTATDAQRQQAAEYAMASGRADQDAKEPWDGKPYNWDFNNKETENSYYCSQLVWAAYKYTSGIDLDSNQSVQGWVLRGSLFAPLILPYSVLTFNAANAVLPDDIVHSSKVETVTQATAGVGRILKRTVIYIFSPGDLYLVGPDGKAVGTDPITKAQVNDVPGALYTGPDSEPEYISIQDMTGNWQLHVVGTDSGPYHLVVEDVNQTQQPGVLTGTTKVGINAIYDLNYADNGTLLAEPQDQLPPTTTFSLLGASGLADWFVSPVTVTVSAIDNPENGVGVRQTEYSFDNGSTWQIYSTPFILTDGIHTMQYRSIDHVNNVEETQTVTIKIDTVPPVITTWLDQTTYTRVEPYVAHYTAVDPAPGSGLAVVTGIFNNQTANNGQTFDLFWLPLGSYTLTVTAKDYAGWTSNDSKTIQIIATIPSMQQAVNRLCSENYITKQGICNSISQKLASALAAQLRGQNTAAVNVLLALQNELNAQKGKAVNDQAYSLLMMDSNYVITNLGGKK